MKPLALSLCAAGVICFGLLNPYDSCIAIPFLLLVILLIAPGLCFAAGYMAGRENLRRFLIPICTAAVMLPLAFMYWRFLPPVYGVVCLIGERMGFSRRRAGRQKI